MATEPVGYARIVDRYALRPLPLGRSAVVDTAVKGRRVTLEGDTERLSFEPKYRPQPGLSGDLQFALRYEGVNLEVLALLFAGTGGAEVEGWLAERPGSATARRAGYLYEWLTGEAIKASVPPKAPYVPVLDGTLQFRLERGVRNRKFRVVDNLPGNRKFCPLVRRTRFLDAMVARNLRRRTADTLARYDRGLLQRAATFLYLKETQSSFEIERERPSPDKARRFADLLREADPGKPLSEDRFAELQQAVVDPRFHEFAYRTRQNWIGRDLGHRKKIDFVPARPEDVPDLMQGLVELAARFRAAPEGIDPVVVAAALSFGFVYIHPFMDGNGRLHRYLVHDVLSSAGFTPPGIVLPVSAVILANLDKYVQALERFSRPLLARTKYDPDVPQALASGNDPVHFRYFDATEQASFLYWALERTVAHDLEEEISFLLGFDAARARLHALADWPGQSSDLFVRLVHQNGGRLSRTKRQAHFAWLTDEELARGEAIVAEAFSSPGTTPSGTPGP